MASLGEPSTYTFEDEQVPDSSDAHAEWLDLERLRELRWRYARVDTSGSR